jgi:hypothetical protein
MATSFDPPKARSSAPLRRSPKPALRVRRTFVEQSTRAAEWSRQNPDEARKVLASILSKRGENAELAKYWTGFGLREGAQAVPRDLDFWIAVLEREGSLPKGKLKAADLLSSPTPKPNRTVPEKAWPKTSENKHDQHRQRPPRRGFDPRPLEILRHQRPTAGGAEGPEPRHPRRRMPCHRRRVGIGQDHAAARAGRSRSGRWRPGGDRRRTGAWRRLRPRRDLPGAAAAALADGARQRRLRPRGAWRKPRPRRGAGAR